MKKNDFYLRRGRFHNVFEDKQAKWPIAQKQKNHQNIHPQLIHWTLQKGLIIKNIWAPCCFALHYQWRWLNLFFEHNNFFKSKFLFQEIKFYIFHHISFFTNNYFPLLPYQTWDLIFNIINININNNEILKNNWEHNKIKKGWMSLIVHSNAVPKWILKETLMRCKKNNKIQIDKNIEKVQDKQQKKWF